MENEQSIFLRILQHTSESDQLAALAEACGDDLELKANVETLLEAHRKPLNLLDRPVSYVSESAIEKLQSPDNLPTTHFDNEASLVGQKICGYRLMEKIGEGGFGLVFVAQQEHPIRRRVALKIVKPGIASQEVLARFDAERQAIGMMDHPHIARVFDVGLSEVGQPFFVMELVRGIKITDFAAAQELTIGARLELFRDVCSAVHHAHQKGVIHRDIKPSNILVTLQDGKPIAKVIDFGVAKAMDHKLTDKTIYTRFFSMIGTPLYMSPEQAEMSGLDVDTRSDIYSLGVLLYELITGMTPFDRSRIDSAGLDELRRIIRDEEPPRPSHRAATASNQSTDIAHWWRSQQVTRSDKRDLDLVVMKSIDKDRSRRYESAAALSDDISRFLNGRPIEARPASVFYLVNRFLRRHRKLAYTAALVLLILIGAAAVSVWQLRTTIRERDQKEVALIQANKARERLETFTQALSESNRLMASGQAHADAGRWANALRDYDEAVQSQPEYFLPWEQRGRLYARMRRWDEAAADYSKALSLGAAIDAPQWWGVPGLFALTQRTDDYASICKQLLQRNEPRGYADLRTIRELSVTQADGERLLRGIGWTRTDLASFAREALIEYSLDATRHSASAMSSHDDFGRRQVHPTLPKPVFHYVSGIAYLRAENWSAATRELRHPTVAGAWPSAPLQFAPLAIVRHQMGDQVESMALLERSNHVVREILEFDEPLSHASMPWFDIVEFFLLNREANRLLNGSTSISDENLEQVRQQKQKQKQNRNR